MSETIESLFEKIPYAMMLFMSLGLLLLFFFPGLANIKVNLDESQEERFQKAVVLENLLNTHPSSEQQENLEYDINDRRSVLAASYFTQKAENGKIGYKIRDSRNCYIPGVKGLNGKKYAFSIVTLQDENPYDISSVCKSTAGAEPIYAPAIIKVDKGKVPVRVMVYRTA